MTTMTVGEIASFLDGEVAGDPDIRIGGVAKIEEAKSGELTFLANPKYEKLLETTGASAAIVGLTLDIRKFSKVPPALIRVAEPYGSFVVVLERFSPKKHEIPPGIAPTAAIAGSAVVGEGCAIGPNVVIGERCRIGARTKIYPNTVLDTGVTVGEDCLIYANVSIREECVIGNRVIIQPGAVVGSDGFGFAPRKDGSYRKIPQLGIVVIEDDVEIGANTCIDRATLGETRVKRGTKLDNLVQVAHNVVIGEDTVIAGQSGVAGSSKIGRRNMIAGNVGIAGHLSTADGVSIGGNSGVSKSITADGAVFFGYPAKEMGRAKRIEGALRQLPELLVTIRDLARRIAELEAALERSGKSERKA